MKHNASYYFWLHKGLWLAGLLLCVVPTAISGYLKLPAIVTTRAETTLTGAAMIVVACCAYPILKGVFWVLKSPSAWFIMLLLASVVTAFYYIPRETFAAMMVILWTAAIGNICGAVLFKISEIFEAKWKIAAYK
jgi:hypothetical protein